MKTLDPKDWAYRGIYDNNNQSHDPSVAHGFNYHQGPEWVWVMGYFLRAYLYFFTKAAGHDVDKAEFHVKEIRKILKAHKHFIMDTDKNPYAGLPELTNQEGKFCQASCQTQAWSASVMVELLLEFQ